MCDQVCTTFSARITYAAGRGNEWGKHWSLIVIFKKQIACSSMRNNWCNQALVSPAQPLITSEQLVSQANNVQQPTYLGCFLHAPAIASSVQQPSVLNMAGHNQITVSTSYLKMDEFKLITLSNTLCEYVAGNTNNVISAR